ncbi:hypothetical protein C5Y25_015015 [Klebsiella pneumoniae subsp. pneumoniae]|nr:hypothetical protein C5Y25_015015 [Klebsiella pneumoniae subsp. pneumoniae]
MMSLWDALRMNMMISYQELVRTFLRTCTPRSSRKFPGPSGLFYVVRTLNSMSRRDYACSSFVLS